MTDNQKRSRYIVFALFALYILAILYVVMVPNSYRGQQVFVGGLTGERWLEYVTRNFNLVPMRGIVEQITNIIAGQHVARNLVYLAGNIIGFMPLGLFLPVLFARQRRFSRFFITVVISVLVLELAQVLMMRGSFDIDDIILNAGGACLGFSILRGRARRLADLPSGGSRPNP